MQAKTSIGLESLPADAKAKTSLLPEYSYVHLVQPVADLPVGAEGTIVMVHPDTHTYIVEFFSPKRSVETVAMNMVAPT